MKPKQLANVLIKILGLSVVVRAVPTLIDGIVNLAVAIRGGPPRVVTMSGAYWSYAATNVFLIIIGIFLISNSRKIAEFLFKGEDE